MSWIKEGIENKKYWGVIFLVACIISYFIVEDMIEHQWAHNLKKHFDILTVKYKELSDSYPKSWMTEDDFKIAIENDHKFYSHIILKQQKYIKKLEGKVK